MIHSQDNLYLAYSLLAGPISHSSIQCMDCVNILLGLSIIHLLVLVGVELPLCVAVTLYKNAMTCFLESS